jgi:hypothetical protein
MEKFRCLKNNCGSGLDITEMYIGILNIGKIYDGERVKGYNGKYIRIYLKERRLLLKSEWFEEVESKP